MHKITPNKVRKLLFPSLSWNELREKSIDDERYGLVYCFYFYSYQYSRITHKLFPDAKTILDFGAGIGASTLLLKQLYESSEVVYFDIERQYAAITNVLKRIFDCKFPVITTFERLTSYDNFDICCCWEVLEHVAEPLKLLDKLFLNFHPKVFSLSASFRLKALGHLETFKVDGVDVKKSAMYRELKRWFISHNYERLKVKLWNNRPWFWVNRNATT